MIAAFLARRRRLCHRVVADTALSIFLTSLRSRYFRSSYRMRGNSRLLSFKGLDETYPLRASQLKNLVSFTQYVAIVVFFTPWRTAPRPTIRSRVCSHSKKSV